MQQPPVTVIGDLRHRKVAVFPNDSCPKIGEVMDMSPDGRGLLLKVSRETQPGSGYREGDVVYFAGSFVLKVIGQAKTRHESGELYATLKTQHLLTSSSKLARFLQQRL